MKTLILLVFLFGTVWSYDVPPTLTELQRLDMLRTNSSGNMSKLAEIRIELINKADIKPTRKRLPDILRYRTTINDEVITMTLRKNKRLISPGCLVHHYTKNSSKLMYPCFNESKHCYYTGKTNHNDSWVAANICGGLTGAIVYGNTSLMITPLGKVKYTDPSQVNNYKHVIYRYHGGKQKCSTKYPTGQVVYPNVSRRRREVRKHYIETSVLIDPTMYNTHGNDTDQYTATALNIASHLYQNRRTGQDIELVITAIYKFESYENIQIKQTTDANTLLHEFCAWKIKKNDPSLKTDATIFLTKIDINFKGQAQTTGLALQNGMCNRRRSCALIEDTGPPMGYTIAHEIGHLLSMQHDGPNGITGCGSSIMDTYGASGQAASTWSSCSKAALAKFLSTDGSRCLLNTPIGLSNSIIHSEDHLLPGVLYTLEDQCKLSQGPDSVPCQFERLDPATVKRQKLNNSCEQLICTDNNLCILSSFPLLDGTDINNTRTWCIDGEPKAMTPDLHTDPIHGGWSAWSAEWSVCTQTCGGGVKTRRRFCNNPKPQFAGKPCPGSNLKAVMCNFKKCFKTYKQTQCSFLDGPRLNYHSWIFTFVPDLSSKGDESCIRQCHGWARETNFTLFVNNPNMKYADGTECQMDHNVPISRCIDGRCQEFGCDGHLDSGLMFDKCGKCNGTSQNCKLVKGTYRREGPAQKFETMLVLPVGSASITVNQHNPYCFLSAVINGERVFNSLGTATREVFISHGMWIEYSNSPEQIKISSPLHVQVIVQVYRRYDSEGYMKVIPDADYEYYETTSNNNPAPYSWSVIQNAQCSRSCGSGITIPLVSCWGLTGPVNDSFCDIYQKPDEMAIPCNTHYCPPKWRASDQTRCSVTCGNGTRHRTVQCVVENDGIATVVSSAQCVSSSRPNEVEQCDMGKCPSVWIVGNWSACSTTCGFGHINRTVNCYDGVNASKQVPDSDCTMRRPDSVKRCNAGPCRWDLVGEKCTDRISCSIYGVDACDGYREWASANCLKYCGICPVVKCEDRINNCADYGERMCTGNYTAWADANCLKFCGKCDDPTCSGYIKARGLEYCGGEYQDWFKRNCPLACKDWFSSPCRDTYQGCQSYNKTYCAETSEYHGWMKANCQHYCHLCEPTPSKTTFEGSSEGGF